MIVFRPATAKLYRQFNAVAPAQEQTGCMNKFKLLPLLFGLLVGCASAPVQEMSDARQAIQAARDAGAERYVPETFSGAERLLNQAEKELGLGMYSAAQRTAVAAKETAIRARETAEAAQKTH